LQLIVNLELKVLVSSFLSTLANYFLGITANVCVSSVVRFRSRVLSPTKSVERRYKLWATPHRTIEETFCWALAIQSTVIEWSDLN
jgi:hypothetical protein